MASRKPKEDDASLPFAALQLLAPPVRLVSAAVWTVMKRRDVTQYGVVEEFVTSVCESVPGLLTARHQSKLTLGLRARLILELCSAQPDAQEIEPHLKRICVPSPPSGASAPPARKDVKIIRTVECFHELVHALLTDPEVKEQFYKEEFPVDYGPVYDRELEKLLWEFLIRLDQLLPVPNLSQTVAWLSGAPAVLEECARAATQPQLLKSLLQHQSCLGHLESAASLPPNMGDSILASLSLPPSGRAPSSQPTGPRKSSADSWDGAQTRDKSRFIAPVIGLISNDDVPIMISAGKRQQRDDEPTSSTDATNGHLNPEENQKFTAVKPKQQDSKGSGAPAGKDLDEERSASKSRSAAVKRKQPDKRESTSDETEEVFGMTASPRKRPPGSVSAEEGTGAAVASRLTRLGIRSLPEDPSLRSIFVSCLSSRARVVVEKLSSSPAGVNGAGGGGKSSSSSSSSSETQQRWNSPVKTPKRKSSSHRPQQNDSASPGLDDKENHPVLTRCSGPPPHRRSHAGTLGAHGGGDDYVADSEDEATKNFKGRLFMKRYYKTKHGTYVPTLREFWKPGAGQRDLALRSKRR